MKTQIGYLVILILFFFHLLTSGAIPLIKHELEDVWKKTERIEAMDENIISVEVKVFGLQKTWKVEGFRNINDIQNQSEACKIQLSTNQAQSECKGK
ncbi:hypothetical protein [Lunatimonas salinarum]|uniref:hypothetical protein n=1 Tax=Lunatimonas salinarum TaxID=1774590 RepID=UPI001ADFAACF|nr:hypothetical protein [Lunatimonas salinarum]